jgi:hypothetical protein
MMSASAVANREEEEVSERDVVAAAAAFLPTALDFFFWELDIDSIIEMKHIFYTLTYIKCESCSEPLRAKLERYNCNIFDHGSSNNIFFYHLFEQNKFLIRVVIIRVFDLYIIVGWCLI